MKYEINQKIGSWVITGWDSVKGNYILTCSCGKVAQGSASFVDFKFKSIDKYGFTACNSCSKKYHREARTTEQKLERVYNKYKKSARTRNLEFSLTLSESIELFKRRCYYCNDLPQNIETTTQVKYQGIDRIDNNKGYISGNVVSCCSFCNYAKHYHSQEKFLEKVDKIYKNVQRLDRKIVEPSGSKWEAPEHQNLVREKI